MTTCARWIWETAESRAWSGQQGPQLLRVEPQNALSGPSPDSGLGIRGLGLQKSWPHQLEGPWQVPEALGSFLRSICASWSTEEPIHRGNELERLRGVVSTLGNSRTLGPALHVGLSSRGGNECSPSPASGHLWTSLGSITPRPPLLNHTPSPTLHGTPSRAWLVPGKRACPVASHLSSLGSTLVVFLADKVPPPLCLVWHSEG